MSVSKYALIQTNFLTQLDKNGEYIIIISRILKVILNLHF